MEKKNKIALLRQRLLDANKNLDDVNDALHNLRTAKEDLRDTEDRKPTLGDFHEPSDEMDIVTGVIGSVSGYLVTKFLL